VYNFLEGVKRVVILNLRRPSYKIENVVASVTLNQRLNLEEIASRVPNAEYNPEHLEP